MSTTSGRVRVLCGLVLLLVSTWAAADVHFRDYFSNPHLIGDRPRIEITGEIVPGDAAAVERLLPTAKAKYLEMGETKPHPNDPTNRPLVVLESPGGNVVEAMKIGRILRKASAWVLVLPDAKCASACVLILASGSTRNVVGYDIGHESEGPVVGVGLHRITFPPEQFASLSAQDARKEYDRVAGDVRVYLDEMGMASELYEDMRKIPSQDIRWLHRSEIKKYLLDGEDPAFGEWIRAKQHEFCGSEWIEIDEQLRKCADSARSKSDADICIANDREALKHISSPCAHP